MKLTAFVRDELNAFLGALRFFTRIPVSDRIPHSDALLNRAARYFPAIGLVVGSASAAAFALLSQTLPANVSILIAMTISIYMTGAFHEDGLTDMTDGLGGGWQKARILEIMKDSRVGSYGVIAISMTLLIKFIALCNFEVSWVPLLLITGHAFSRYCSVLVMAAMDYVREDALSKSKPLATKLSSPSLMVASFFGLGSLCLLPWLPAIAGATAGLAITLWLGRKLKTWLGGYTGDCLGAAQQLSEVAFYVGALAALH